MLWVNTSRFTEWWNLLQRIENGGDVVIETDTFADNANAAAKE